MNDALLVCWFQISVTAGPPDVGLLVRNGSAFVGRGGWVGGIGFVRMEVGTGGRKQEECVRLNASSPRKLCPDGGLQDIDGSNAPPLSCSIQLQQTKMIPGLLSPSLSSPPQQENLSSGVSFFRRRHPQTRSDVGEIRGTTGTEVVSIGHPQPRTTNHHLQSRPP